MKRILMLLTLIVVGWQGAHAATPLTHSISTKRILVIDPSSMPLTIGILQRTNNVYLGDYNIKVFPYFLKNEKGRLAIVISDESLAGIDQGKVTTIIGTPVTLVKAAEIKP